MSLMTKFDESSDLLTFITPSDHYCIIINSVRNIRLHEDGTLDATPIYGPYDHETFVCDTYDDFVVKLHNIESAGYKVNWEGVKKPNEP